MVGCETPPFTGSTSPRLSAVRWLVLTGPATPDAGAFDDLESIGKECRRLGLWLHVDGAYGGAYSCLPELAELFAGLQFADSYCVNCHKKLLCPFDLCALFLADRNPILAALSLQPEYGNADIAIILEHASRISKKGREALPHPTRHVTCSTLCPF